MIAGHFAAAIIAHQKYPKGTLIFYLIACQFQDLLWLLFHYLGLEPTGPDDVLDATLQRAAIGHANTHWLAAARHDGRVKRRLLNDAAHRLEQAALLIQRKAHGDVSNAFG